MFLCLIKGALRWTLYSLEKRVWNVFMLKWVWGVAAFDRTSKGSMKIFSEREKQQECIFRLAEREASITPLTTQRDPEEWSNQGYSNFPHSNFAALLRLNVWYNTIMWLCWWQVVHCGLGPHIDLACMCVWVICRVHGVLFSNYSIMNISSFLLRFVTFSFWWQQLVVVADRIKSARGKYNLWMSVYCQ